MKKDRLFVFGDSWAYNYFSKQNKLIPNLTPFFGSLNIENFVSYYNNFGHWIDHMNYFYDVYSYAVGSASNEQIIYQMGNLPEYKDGDRIVMMFTPPSRFRWIRDKKIYGLSPHGTQIYETIPKESIELIETQYIERNELWIDKSIETEEQKFLNLLPTLLKKYNPVLITWCEEISLHTTSIELIGLDDKYTTINDESGGLYEDGHLGVFGNYELFKFISKKLSIDYSKYKFNPIPFEKTII